MGKDKLTYRSAIEELEEIVNDIDSGEVDVDVLTVRVKRAAELIKFCKDNLRATQQEVTKVLESMEAKEVDTAEETD